MRCFKCRSPGSTSNLEIDVKINISRGHSDMEEPCQDWQATCKNLKERGARLRQSGQWADCTFLVGNEPDQIEVKGHKLFLAMASPVFEAMFYGGMPERNDPIPILDVQPEAFDSLLQYIYSDEININSFDKACELCYAAKKYMLPHLVQECTNFLWSDLNPKNVCRAYEFAKLFEEPTLMERCLQIICTQTLEVLSKSNFEEIELSTLTKIFEQDALNIDNELELFNAALRYVNAQVNIQNPVGIQKSVSRASLHNRSLQSSDSSSSLSENRNENETPPQNDSEKMAIDTTPSTSSHVCKSPSADDTRHAGAPTIKNAVQKIRFLTLSPQEFAEGPARSNLLSQSEAFAILMNISSPKSDIPMPEGFTTSTHRRNKLTIKWPIDYLMYARIGERPESLPGVSNPKRHLADPIQQTMVFSNNRESNKYFCNRSIAREVDCMNTNDLECSVTFTVDKNICVVGVQIPTQVLNESTVKYETTYSELLYAHLLDADGSRLTYTHYTSRVRYNEVIDINFNRSFYIQRNKVYKVAVVFNKLGWYPLGLSHDERIVCENVCFSFGVGPTSDSVKDGLIRSIIFTY